MVGEARGHLCPSLLIQVSPGYPEAWTAEAVEGRGVCRGQAPPCSLPCSGHRGLPGWPRVLCCLCTLRRHWGMRPQSATCTGHVVRLARLSTRMHPVGGKCGVGNDTSCPPVPAACSTWAGSITASLLTSRAPFLPMASSPKTRRPSTRQCCGAAAPS